MEEPAMSEAAAYRKRLSFETARDQVRYTLNRRDLLDWERAHLTRIVADLEALLPPLPLANTS